MTLEGVTSEQTLREFADTNNRRGVVPVFHKTAFADLPTESARSKASHKHAI